MILRGLGDQVVLHGLTDFGGDRDNIFGGWSIGRLEILFNGLVVLDWILDWMALMVSTIEGYRVGQEFLSCGWSMVVDATVTLCGG